MNRELLISRGLGYKSDHRKYFSSADISVLQSKTTVVLCKNENTRDSLADIFSGMLEKTEGTLLYLNKKTDRYTLRKSAGLVNKKDRLTENLSIIENIMAVSTEEIKFFYNPKSAKEKYMKIMKEYNCNIPFEKSVRSLSEYEQYVLLILKQIVLGKKLIIINNVAENFTQKEYQEFLEVLNKLNQNKITVLYISSGIDKIVLNSKYIYVMRYGRVVKKITDNCCSLKQLETYLYGYATENKIKNSNTESIGTKTDTEYFNLYPGEIIGIYDALNNSKEFVKTIQNMHEPTFIYSDAVQTDFIENFSVKDNLLMPIISDISCRAGIIRNNEQSVIIEHFMKQTGFDKDLLDLIIADLPIYERWQLIIYRHILKGKEPYYFINTALGYDKEIAKLIYSCIFELAAKKYPVVYYSGNLNELQSICDIVYNFIDGNFEIMVIENE